MIKLGNRGGNFLLLSRFLLLQFVLLASGAYAAPATVERMEGLVMPGDVIKGHARFEAKCDKCHERFDKNSQSKLCRDCHELIDIDLKESKGFHGKINNVEERECHSCHTDHKGRDMDIIQLDIETFDHDRTNFKLNGVHASLACTDCHSKKNYFRLPKKSTCYDCHEQDDSHKGRMGKECKNCHTEEGFFPAYFDHDETEFKLKYTHNNVGCQYCHVNERYFNTPKNCYFCHYLDDTHEGDRGKKCEECHHEQRWSRIEFDHDKDTSFKLNHAHTRLLCKDCHEGNVFKDIVKLSCYSCHKVHDVHFGNYGKRCQVCHSERDWDDIRFEHDEDTSFKLKGEHKDLQCNACHKGDIFHEDLSGGCSQCHRLDDAHSGQVGEKCSNCHNEDSWINKVVFDHALTKFPLHGEHVLLTCEDCHTSGRYQDVEVDCISCHEKDDVHEEKLGKGCSLCHGPVHWMIWRFDHDKQSDFPLDGKHKDLDCHACHKEPVRVEIELAMDCYSCHRKDDAHDGQLGTKCEKCHITESFKTIKLKE